MVSGGEAKDIIDRRNEHFFLKCGHVVCITLRTIQIKTLYSMYIPLILLYTTYTEEVDAAMDSTIFTDYISFEDKFQPIGLRLDF